MNIDILGFVAGSFTTFCFVPQVWKTIKTKSTNGISLLYFIFVNIGIVLWLIYAILKHDFALLYANFFTLIFASTVLFYKLRNVITGKEKP
jgi:MtN3 and saliva related transmembrane protein